MKNRLEIIEKQLIELKNDPTNEGKFCDTLVSVAQLFSDYKRQEEQIKNLEDTFVNPNIK